MFSGSPGKTDQLVHKNTIKSAFALTQCRLKYLKVENPFFFLKQYCLTNNLQNPMIFGTETFLALMIDWLKFVTGQKRSFKWTTESDSIQFLCRILTVWSTMSKKIQNIKNIFLKQYCFARISESLQNLAKSYQNRIKITQKPIDPDHFFKAILL